MSFSRFEEKHIQNLLGNDVVSLTEKTGDLFVITRGSALVRVATILYSDPELEFKSLIDALAIDMLFQKNKFEIYYQLYSDKIRRHLFLGVEISEFETVPSLSLVFKSASWYEREIFDMFGILFSNHNNLRRILTSPESQGFSLKKDRI